MAFGGVFVLLVGAAGGYVAGRAVETPPLDEQSSLIAGPQSSEPPPLGAPASTWFTVSDGPVPGTADRPIEVKNVLRRTSTSGLSIRVLSTEVPAPAGCNGCPPPECLPTLSYQMFVVDEWAVASGGGSGRATVKAPGEAAGGVYGGVPFGTARSVVGMLVRTTNEVANARLYDTGNVLLDEAVPINGLVALAGTSSADARRGPPDVRTELIGRDGKGLASLALADAGNIYSDPACRVMAPTGPTVTYKAPLPTKGEQPSDVAAATTAVKKAFDAVVGSDVKARDAAIDDAEGFGAGPGFGAPGASGGVPPSVVVGERVIDDVVFTSPTRASFRYSVPSFNGGIPGGYSNVGQARLVEGKWKITRASACMLVYFSGPSC